MTRVPRRFVDAGLALAFFAAAFLLRSLPGAGQVLAGPTVRFRTPDPLYHMRIVDLLVERFLAPVRHDALLLWPHGQAVSSGPLFDYLIAAPALLLGLGHPSRHLVDLCGAFLPPLLGGLLVAAFWLLGRAPLGRAGAALAAALAAVLPGQLLQRTALGYADHHAASLLFLGLYFALLFRAAWQPVEAGARRDATWAGAALTLLVLAWPWGAAFAGVAALWGVLDGALRPDSRACALLARATAVAAPIVLLGALVFPVLRKPAALLVVVTLATVLASRARTRLGRLTHPLLVVLGMGLAGAVFIPEALLQLALRFRPSASGATVAEARPLLGAGPGLLPVLREFWTGLFAGLYGANIAFRSLRSRPESGLLLLLLFVTGLLALSQARFGGEAALVAALLGGLIPAYLFEGLAGLSRARAMAGQAIVLSGLLALLVVPAALVAPSVIRQLPVDDGDWEETMSWMRENTPDPFAPAAPDGSARYSVLSWWDNGYRIARLGHRVPITNPTQTDATWAARALLVDDEAAAVRVLESRAVRYVVLDALFPFSRLPSGRASGQFSPLLLWAGADPGRYFAVIRERGRTSPSTIFFADYYRTLGFRLWRYGGAASAPAGPVLAFLPPAGGRQARLERFPSWEEADRFVRSGGAGWRIASEDPRATCVPLDAWPAFRRAHSSPRDALRASGARVARVELVERIP